MNNECYEGNILNAALLEMKKTNVAVQDTFQGQRGLLGLQEVPLDLLEQLDLPDLLGLLVLMGLLHQMQLMHLQVPMMQLKTP